MDKRMINGLIAGMVLIIVFTMAYVVGEKLKKIDDNAELVEQCIEIMKE